MIIRPELEVGGMPVMTDEVVEQNWGYEYSRREQLQDERTRWRIFGPLIINVLTSALRHPRQARQAILDAETDDDWPARRYHMTVVTANRAIDSFVTHDQVASHLALGGLKAYASKGDILHTEDNRHIDVGLKTALDIRVTDPETSTMQWDFMFTNGWPDTGNHQSALTLTTELQRPDPKLPAMHVISTVAAQDIRTGQLYAAADYNAHTPNSGEHLYSLVSSSIGRMNASLQLDDLRHLTLLASADTPTLQLQRELLSARSS